MGTILLNGILLIAGVALLYYGAEWLIAGGIGVAKRFGLSSLVIGLTLVAFATSMPELLVSIQAACQGNADISLGNVVGSNTCNVALILGLSAIISPITPKKSMMKTDLPFFLFSAILLCLFYYLSGGIDRLTGAFFFAGILFYTWWSIRSARKEGVPEEESDPESEKIRKRPLILSLLIAAGGVAALVAGADFFVKSSVFFARMMHVSDAVIGLTLVAVGTSLPELATSVVAAIKGENDIAIGNIVGSNIFNILCILGIAPLIRPLRSSGITPVDFGIMLGATGLLVVNLRTGWKLTRAEGVVFVLIYALYTAWLVYSQVH